MSQQEYFLVFESIFYGLLIAQILNILSKMIYHLGDYKFYWGFLGFIISNLMSITQIYYVESFLFHEPTSVLEFFILNLSVPGCYYLMMAQILPATWKGLDPLNWLTKRRFLWGLPGIAATVSIFLNNLIELEELSWLNYFIPGTLIVAFATFLFYPKKWVFEANVVYWLLITVYFWFFR